MEQKIKTQADKWRQTQFSIGKGAEECTEASSGIQHRVVRWKSMDVSEEHAASIFTAGE
jgi:hypothetical protein